MTDDEADAQLNVLYTTNQAEHLKTRIADICEDYGSTDRTLAGIADAEDRTRCEKQIAREHRDHARNIREHFAWLAIQTARKKARMRDRLKPQRDVDSKRHPFSVLPAREIMKKFNTRKKTG